ncbi:uncharacterized protein FMAN_10699 [Fusarium mangiferae]|uniref:Uncharacterized protein n=1 Tax=Fusarium mangiferae TaxID=192010 RepID=A0A1L7UED7_FUSMA|nr:uncharacterized protein FMAN_10699 [Fusarium mangiferae]CVL05506.1 uncharacterized protein FMAN_10699 [Fusarium mangiferae]
MITPPSQIYYISPRFPCQPTVNNNRHKGVRNLNVAKENKVANACTQAKESVRDGSSTDQPNADDEESSLFRGNPEKQKQMDQLEAFSETLAKLTTRAELFVNWFHKLSGSGSDSKNSITFQVSAARFSGKLTAFTFDEDGGDNEDGNDNGTNKADVANSPGLEFAL